MPLTARLLMLLPIIAALSACHQESAAPPTCIRIGIPSEPVTMDPHAQDDGSTWTVLANIYEALVAFDSNLKLEPALAERWENPDSRTWMFFLRTGVRFHDGKVLDADDVTYSLLHALDDPQSQLRSRLTGVVEVVSPVPHVVEVKTKFPDPVLLNKLTSVFIVPRDFYATAGRRPCGTGPYLFEERKRGGTVYVERFSHYWGKQGSIERAVFVPLPDQSHRATELLQGRIRLVTRLPVDSLPRLTGVHGVRAVIAAGTTVSYLGFRFHQKDLPFDDVRFRRAVYLGIDVRRMIKKAFLGYGEPPTQFVLPVIFGYDPRLPQRTHDPIAAKQLIAGMGDVGRRHLVLEMPENAAKVISGDILRDLRAIGLDIEVVTHPWKEFYSRQIAGKMDFYFSGWSCGSGDASDFFDSCVHSPVAGLGDANVGGFSDAQLDRLIEQSHQIMRSRDRLVLLQRIMAVSMEKLPVVPLYVVNEYNGVADSVTWVPRADSRILVREIRLSGSPTIPPAPQP